MGRDKMTVEVGGRTLLRRTVDAALEWADAVIVAGPEPVGWEWLPGVGFVQEDPPFGGPSAGVAAAVAEIAAEKDEGEVLLLAGDLANPDLAVRDLAEALPRDGLVLDGLVLEDADGWPQLLAGIYRLQSLRDAVAAWTQVRGVSIRRLLGGLDLDRIKRPRSITDDLDTPQDISRTFGL